MIVFIIGTFIGFVVGGLVVFGTYGTYINSMMRELHSEDPKMQVIHMECMKSVLLLLIFSVLCGIAAKIVY